MTPEESAWLEEQFPLLLAACDEALAAGTPAESLSGEATPAALRPRLEREVAWCDLVRRLRRGDSPSTIPTDAAAGAPREAAGGATGCGALRSRSFSR